MRDDWTKTSVVLLHQLCSTRYSSAHPAGIQRAPAGRICTISFGTAFSVPANTHNSKSSASLGNQSILPLSPSPLHSPDLGNLERRNVATEALTPRSNYIALVSSQVLTETSCSKRIHMGFVGSPVCHAGLSRMVAMAHMVRNESPRFLLGCPTPHFNPQPNSSVVPGSGTCKGVGWPLGRSHPRILAGRACQEQTHGWPYSLSGTRHRKQHPANNG